MLDVVHRNWSQEVLNATGLKQDLLPSLSESTQVCGKVSARGAEETGLKPGTPVVAGSGDQAAGAIGIELSVLEW